MYVWRRGIVHTMFLVGKPARKIPLGRPGHGLDYSVSRHRHVGVLLVNMATNLRVP
jgi:hypothetical protein